MSRRACRLPKPFGIIKLYSPHVVHRGEWTKKKMVDSSANCTLFVYLIDTQKRENEKYAGLSMPRLEIYQKILIAW